MWDQIVSLVGTVYMHSVIKDALWNFIQLLLSFVRSKGPLIERFGTWAAVTGGTDGIGKQYCMELARRGLNIVVISRNPDKLRAVAAEIEKEHNVKTKTVVADFSRGAEVYAHIEQELKDIPLGILVNNVGSLQEYPMKICEVPQSKDWEMINVNVGSVTAMTRIALPGMLERGTGAIVNVSSGAEMQPGPYLATYAATKAYVRSYTLALREEYSSQGIHVQHVSPFYVATNMVAYNPGLRERSLFVPDAKAFAKYAVAMLGRLQDTSGYWAHGVQTFLMKLIPHDMRIKLVGYINKKNHDKHIQSMKNKSE